MAIHPLIYIAGPYRGASESDAWSNIMVARAAATQLWARGYIAFCPHLNSMLMGGVAPDRAFIEGDLVILGKCDAVLTVGNWHLSEGTQAEMALAERLGIPVYRNMGDLRTALPGDRW